MIFWGILALIIFIIDMITTGSLLLGFSISALITSILSSILLFKIEIIFFIATGTVLTILLIPKIKKTPEIKSYSDSLEGTIIKANKSMLSGELYQEKVKGTFWNIKCIENINENQNIKIIKVDKENNCLIAKGE